ncbi:MAG: hypothetical protein AAF183_23345, partial [Pseudomonadota bacterium]
RRSVRPTTQMSASTANDCAQLPAMRERRHPNVVAVALANKNARIVWSVLASGDAYQTRAGGSGGLTTETRK